MSEEFGDRLDERFDFCIALDLLKEGHKVAREGWNGKGMFIFYTPGNRATVHEGCFLAGIVPVGSEFELRPYVMMKTAQGDFVPWLASQTDLLAEDWQVLE